MSIHKEISFEDEICNHLAASRWLYADGDAARYDRARAATAVVPTNECSARQPS